MDEMILVTFGNVTDAMAMEAASDAAGLDGKLIPLPDALSAGCGYAWKHNKDQEAALRDLINEKSLDISEIMDWKE